ncbi:MAG: sensor histidine kinase [Bacillota bacterium]|nr:sensor histidine kinase [Bacillota bacterium]
MKQFFRTIAGKTVLFISCLLFVSCLIGSVAAAGLMIRQEFYTHTEEELYEDLSFGSMVQNTNHIINRHEQFLHTFYKDRLSGKPHADLRLPVVLHEGKNLAYEILYKDKVLIRSDQNEDGKADVVWKYKYSLRQIENSSEYEFHSVNDPNQTGLYIRIGFVNNLPYPDEFSFLKNVIGILYALKYRIYFIGFIAGVLALTCFISLLSVSGRRRGSDALHPGILNQVPFDGLAATVLIFFSFLFSSFLHNIGSVDQIFVGFLFLIVASGFAAALIGIGMSTAVRIKQGTFLRNNLLFIIPLHLWKATIRIGISLKHAFSGMKIFTRASLILLILVFIDFIIFQANLHSSASRQFFIWLFKTLVLVCTVMFAVSAMEKLRKSGKALANGDLSHQVNTMGLFFDFKSHAEDLNSIAKGMSIAVEERLKSERMKTELITNVSHDLKTPLTSIVNYSNLLNEANGADNPDREKIREYSDVLIRQSDKLKNLIEDLVEASKASTGNVELSLAPSDASLYLSQICGEYADRLEKAGLIAVMDDHAKDDGHFIMADGRRMWRIFDNIMNNICKYSLRGTRVYLALDARGKDVVFSFKNTSSTALNIEPDELFERFTRGDKSRSTEGSGLGLSIAKSLTELQGGTMEIVIDGDLFKVIVKFPKINAKG